MRNNKIYSALALLCWNLFITSLILVTLSYFSILILDVIISSKIVFWIGIFFCILFIVFREKSGKSFSSKVINKLAD